jgi:hypothetical protein
MMPAAWRTRLSVLSVVVVAHWIAFGTMPLSQSHWGSGVSGRGLAATSVSVRIVPAPTPTVNPGRARPVINKMLAQPDRPAAQANENPAPQTPDPDSDGLYGVSGMLDDESPIVLRAPQPTRLTYDSRGEINGRAYHSGAELLWQHDGKTYEVRMDIADLSEGSRAQTSNGLLTERGLEPLRFEDKSRSEVAAQFDHAAGKVRFGPAAAEADLVLGAQDQLSVFIQLATVFAGNADRLPAGSALAFQTIGALSWTRWAFTVVGPEVLVLPTGPITAIHLTRDPGAEPDETLDLWLAPETGYLPLRIRLSQSSSNFVEQEWRATGSP